MTDDNPMDTAENGETLRWKNRMLEAISQAQSGYIEGQLPSELFGRLLANLLSLTDSDYGFVGEVLKSESGDPYLKTHAITNIAWNEETRRLYKEHEVDGMEFDNLKTLFGHVMTSGEPVVANMPSEDSRRGGLPAGHPALDAFLGLPLYDGGLLVGMAAAANRPGGYDQKLIDDLGPFTTTCASTVSLYRERSRGDRVERALTREEARS